MSAHHCETDVLIVGAGPVGLSLAMDLRYRGVDFLLAEAGDGTVAHPKVSTIGPRSMELFRRWGVAEKIRDAGWPGDHPLDAAWVTRVGGHELFRLALGTADSRSLPEHTPESNQICPAHWLTPLLMREVGVHPEGPVRTECTLEDFSQCEDGVLAVLREGLDGKPLLVRARYLVACDGSSSQVRKACGIDAPARHESRLFRNILFRAPKLRDQLGERNALVHFLMLSATLRFPMRAVDGCELYNLVVGADGGAGAEMDALSLVSQAIALPTPVEVLSDSPWRLTHRVADRFRQGRVFLVGDAAHTLSLSGGFGMSTGICGAADLGWKLAAELAGWAGSALLDSYEQERRPVALASLEEANGNLLRTVRRPLSPQLHQESAAGERARAEMSRHLAESDLRREFDAPQVHFGAQYRSPIVQVDPAAPAGGDQPWRQSAAPGSRAPHAWLRGGVSTLDLFGPDFVMLCRTEPERRWQLEHAFAQRGVPLTTAVCPAPAVTRVYERAHVLVRPDGHVAWWGDELPRDLGWLADKVRGAGAGG